MESVFSIKETGSKIFAKTLTEIHNLFGKLAKDNTDLRKNGGLGETVAPKDAAARLKAITAELKQAEAAQAKLVADQKKAKDYNAYFELEKSAKAYEARVKTLQAEQARLNSTLAQTETSAAGDPYSKAALTTGVRSVRAIGGIFQNVGAQTGGGITSQIGGLITDTSQYKDDLKDLSEQFRTADGGLSRMGRALGGLGTAIGFTGAITAGVTLGFEGYNRIVGFSTELVHRHIEARQREMELENQRNELLRTGSSTAVQGQINALKDEQATREQTRDDSLAALTAETNIFDQIRTIAEVGVNQLTGNTQAAINVYGEAGDAVEQLNTDLGNTTDELQVLVDVLQQIKAREAGDRLKSNVIEAEADILATRRQASEQARSFELELTDFQEQQGYERLQTLRERARQDLQESREHEKKLTDLAREGQRNIEKAYVSFAKETAQLLKRQAKEDAKALLQERKAEQKALESFAKGQARQDRQYERDALKEQKQYLKDRLRAEQDLNDALMDAELSNNVVAFLQAEREAAKNRTRSDQDRAEQQADREDTRAQEKADAKEALDEQLADMHEAAAEERADREEARRDERDERVAAFRETIADLRAQTAEQIAEEKASYAERRASEREERIYQDQLRREQNARQIDQMHLQFNREIEQLKRREDQAQTVIDSGGRLQLSTVQQGQYQIVSAYQDGANQAVAAIRATMGGIGGGGSNKAFGYSGGKTFQFARTGKTYTSGGGKGVFAAEGGVFREPTLTMLAESRPEAVIPMDQSGGLPNLGTSMTFDFSGMTIGGDVSRDEVQHNLRRMAQSIYAIVEGGRSGQKPTLILQQMARA